MKTSKYYTPEISEFHVDFEYEIHNDPRTEDGWDKELIEKWEDLKYPTMEDSDADYRVKFLDKEDIESLDFRYGEVSKKEVRGETIDLSMKGDKYVIHAVGEYNRNKLFEGTIRNLSELKKLLKQLGI